MFCPTCGEQNDFNNYKCTRCGLLLHVEQQVVVTDDNTFGGLIPHKNPHALWAYYLVIFSIIPVLGVPLGVAALVLGIKGLKAARAHPEVKGKIHAWTGVILGGLLAVMQLVVILLLAIVLSK